MAADGSIKFDTKVNTDGFDEGISILSKAMDKLTNAVDRLSDNIIKRFNGIQTAAENISQGTKTAEEGVDQITDSMKAAEQEAAELQKQMDKIQVYDMEEVKTEPLPERRIPITNSDSYGYDKSALEFVEQYGEKTVQTKEHVNELLQKLTDLKAELKELEKQGFYYTDDKFDETYLKWKEARQAVADYKKELDNPSLDSDTLQGQIDNLKKELNKLASEGRTWGDSLYDSTYQAWKMAQAELNQYKKDLVTPVKIPVVLDPNSFAGQIQQLKKQLADLENQGITMGMPKYDQLYTQLQKVMIAQKQHEAYLKNLAQLSNQTGDAIGGEGKKAGMTAEQMERLAREKAEASTENKKLGDKADDTSSKLNKEGKNAKWLSAMLNIASVSLLKLGKGMLGTAAHGLSKLGKGFKTSGNQAKTGNRNMTALLKQMILFSMVHKIISGISSAFKEGIQNLAGYSSSFNTIMSSFVSSLSQLKNSFASSFSPLTSIAIPALDALIQKLIQAINVIGQFLAALTGKGTFVRAVKVNQDYAKSLQKTGGAAKQAGQDAKKALAPFDDLIQIQQQGTDSSGAGGGAGGIDPSQMFEEAAIDSGIRDFANKLREMFEAGDWEGIGQLIGEKINEAVQRFTDYISWDNVEAKITAFVTAFTTVFNSLVAKIDWYSIGVMIGTGINTLAHTLYLLLTQIDWFMLGNALSQGLMGIVNTVEWDLFGAVIGAYLQAKISGLLGFIIGADWKTIGAALATCIMGITGQISWEQLGYLFAAGFNAAFGVLGEFARTFEWAEFGSQIATSLSTFFRSFDWAGAGTAVSDIVLGLLESLTTFIQQTDWWAFGQGVSEGIQSIDWSDIVNSLFEFIGSFFGGFGAFLGGLISDGIAGAQEYFQGKIEECGGSIPRGILLGILDGLSGLAKWIIDNIATPFIKGVNAAFGLDSSTPILFLIAQELWPGFCNGIKETFANVGSFVKENITDPFINAVKNGLGVHSPSTVLQEIGDDTVAGFNKGITGSQGTSQTVVQSWASGVATWFANKLGISSGNSAEAQRWASSTTSGFNNTVNSDSKNSQSVMENWALNVRKWFVGTSTDKGVNTFSWKKFADDIIKAFSETVQTKHTDNQTPVETWAENIRKWFVADGDTVGVNEASWTKFAETIINAFKIKIESSHSETQGPMETWADNVREWFWGDSNTEGTGGLYDAFYNMAKRINEGFAQGISDFAHMAKAAIREWASEVMAEAEEEFDINSPSKEFYGIAEYVVKGFNNGLLALASSSRSAAQKWLDGVLDVFDGVNIQIPVGLDIPNAASYIPRVALGAVVPPRAGEAASAMKSSSYAQEEAFAYLLAKMDEMISKLQANGEQPIQITLNLTGNLAALARILKPELDKEAARKGVSLVVIGGT